ncbi:MAG: Error-prone repair protein ImuA [Marivirga sp.]|nr:Error-prone repair protein ImuA [Marivirga sp.]
MSNKRADIISELQREILLLQGFKPANSAVADTRLGPLKSAFPNASFPLGAIHEFLSVGAEASAATSGFISGLLSTLMGGDGTLLWISSSRNLFPPALKNFGIQPDRIIFIDLQKEKDVVWTMEEALKCGALNAVVGEMQEISFTTSRRLQLAVEQSQVTGFVLRSNPRMLNTTACVSRWKITPLPSESDEKLPGVGFPQWRVELLRIRNGRPGIWEIRWEDGRFEQIDKSTNFLEQHKITG